jgi:hypothetical protein
MTVGRRGSVEPRRPPSPGAAQPAASVKPGLRLPYLTTILALPTLT